MMTTCGTPIARASHIDVHTALGPFGHDSLLVVDVRGEPGHVVDLGSVCAALGGDGTAEGLELIKGEGYHVEVIRDSQHGEWGPPHPSPRNAGDGSALR